MTVDDRFTDDFRERQVEREDLGTWNEIVTGPVSDWTTDWSHTEPEYNERAIEIWEDLRGRCPIARTERFGGAWLPTRYEDVQAIAYDTERFSSRAIIAGNYRPPLDLAPVGLVDAGGEPEEGRLAGAVRPHDADSLAHRDRGVDGVEDDERPDLAGHVRQAEERHRQAPSPVPGPPALPARAVARRVAAARRARSALDRTPARAPARIVAAPGRSPAGSRWHHEQKWVARAPTTTVSYTHLTLPTKRIV